MQHTTRQTPDSMEALARAATRELRAAAMSLCDPVLSREEQIARDLQLVERICGGEKAAFQEVYRLYAPSLFERILRMLHGNMEMAEDCLQQVFAQALQSLHSYKGHNILHAWLNRLTTFIVMDEFRAQRGRQGTLKKLWWSWDPRVKQSEAVPERLFVKEETRQMIQAGLAELSAKKRMAIVLCDLEGYSVDEAAAELGVAPGTVASRLHHGRKELRMLILENCRNHGLSVEDWLHV